jgi:hypothetical protein
VTVVDTAGLLRQFDQGFRDRARESPAWFTPALIAVVALGAIVRVAFAISVWSRTLPGDAYFFHASAASLAHGKGYNTLTGVSTAQHPPVFPSLLAVFDLVGLQSVGAQRIAVSVVASAGVLLVGLVGRRVGGGEVGIVAAVIAAVDPLWFQSSGILMSESVYLVAIPGVLLVALLCVERPTVVRFAALGILIGIATLIRSEAIDLVLLLGIPVVLIAARDWRTRILTGLAVVVGLFLMLTPWLVRNEVQLGGLSLSTDGGVTLAGSYCPATFDPNEPYYGSFNIICALAQDFVLVHSRSVHGEKPYSQLELNTALTKGAETFARGHLSDMPGVVVARELSVWGFGNQDYQLAVANAEGRVRGFEQAGYIVYWVLLPFVVLGSVVLARNAWRPCIIVIAPLVVVAVNAALFYGSTRMRMAAEPSLALLASIGVVAVVHLSLDHRRVRPPPEQPASREQPASLGSASGDLG